MVLQLSSGGGVGLRLSRIVPTFLIHPGPYQPQQSHKGLRAHVIQKLDAAQATSGLGTGDSMARGGTGKMVDSEEGQTEWNEDDLILFLWSNAKAAKEHQWKEVEENTQHMEQWRQGIVSSSLWTLYYVLYGHAKGFS